MISQEQIRARAQKFWTTGQALRAWVKTEPLFPYPIPFRKPSAQEWLNHYAEMRAQVEQLEVASKVKYGAGYTVVFKDIAHQKLGRLRVPERIVFESIEDVAACIGESAALKRFQELTRMLRMREPRLLNWLADHPLSALEHEPVFPRLLTVAAYLQTHPRPMRYARELGIPGVDSKFIEEHQALLYDWLDRLLPIEALDVSVRGLSDHGFERRFGLRYEEPLIRFRWLDRRLALAGGITDVTVPISQFIAYAPSCARVFVTENKTSFLTLPECDESLAVFGSGYAIDNLGNVPWLTEKLYYWGDIDTHGFAILNRLRGYWPRARSFLMDRDTLLGHRKLWSEEPQERRCLHDLMELNADERGLYDDLRCDRLGVRVRLEQERIEYDRVLEAVAIVGPLIKIGTVNSSA